MTDKNINHGNYPKNMKSAKENKSMKMQMRKYLR